MRLPTEIPYGLEHKRYREPAAPRPQLHTKKPKPPPGPRTLERRRALHIRERMLATGRTLNLTVEAVRQQTRLNEHDRALRATGRAGQRARKLEAERNKPAGKPSEMT